MLRKILCPYFATYISSHVKYLFKSFGNFKKLCYSSSYGVIIFLYIFWWIPLRGSCLANSLWLIFVPIFQRVVFNFSKVQCINFFMTHTFCCCYCPKKSFTNLRSQIYSHVFSLGSFIVLGLLYMVWYNARGSFFFLHKNVFLGYTPFHCTKIWFVRADRYLISTFVYTVVIPKLFAFMVGIGQDYHTDFLLDIMSNPNFRYHRLVIITWMQCAISLFCDQQTLK